MRQTKLLEYKTTHALIAKTLMLINNSRYSFEKYFEHISQWSVENSLIEDQSCSITLRGTDVLEDKKELAFYNTNLFYLALEQEGDLWTFDFINHDLVEVVDELKGILEISRETKEFEQLKLEPLEHKFHGINICA